MRSRPFWPLLTAALIGLPVLYVASFGPVVWIFDYCVVRGRVSQGGSTQIFLEGIYHPVLWVMGYGPNSRR